MQVPGTYAPERIRQIGEYKSNHRNLGIDQPCPTRSNRSAENGRDEQRVEISRHQARKDQRGARIHIHENAKELSAPEDTMASWVKIRASSGRYEKMILNSSDMKRYTLQDRVCLLNVGRDLHGHPPVGTLVCHLDA